MDSRIIQGIDKNVCWQSTVRSANLNEDIEVSGYSKEYLESLTCADFTFKVVVDPDERKQLKAFIERHEWLGNLSQYTTHWFATYHATTLAGVVLMGVPNAFSKMLGENTPHLERLISRGACISWSPKNLASTLIMQAIHWTVQNTDFRLFTAYSDPNAKELGTIYQACNFFYLGRSAGTETRYINPYTGKLVSDRFFRQKSAYKKYAQELEIAWQKNWSHSTGMNWQYIPNDIEEQLRQFSKDKQSAAQMVKFPAKHKYAYVLGKDKKETRQLRKKFLSRNKVYDYPKERGQ